VDEEEQGSLMHFERLREGKGLPNEPGQALTEGVIPSLDVSGHSRLFATRRVLTFREHLLIGFPKVGETMTLSIGFGNGFPEFSTSLGASISTDYGHDLSSGAAHR